MENIQRSKSNHLKGIGNGFEHQETRATESQSISLSQLIG